MPNKQLLSNAINSLEHTIDKSNLENAVRALDALISAELNLHNRRGAKHFGTAFRTAVFDHRPFWGPYFNGQSIVDEDSFLKPSVSLLNVRAHNFRTLQKEATSQRIILTLDRLSDQQLRALYDANDIGVFLSSADAQALALPENVNYSALLSNISIQSIKNKAAEIVFLRKVEKARHADELLPIVRAMKSTYLYQRDQYAVNDVDDNLLSLSELPNDRKKKCLDAIFRKTIQLAGENYREDELRSVKHALECSGKFALSLEQKSALLTTLPSLTEPEYTLLRKNAGIYYLQSFLSTVEGPGQKDRLLNALKTTGSKKFIEHLIDIQSAEKFAKAGNAPSSTDAKYIRDIVNSGTQLVLKKAMLRNLVHQASQDEMGQLLNSSNVVAMLSVYKLKGEDQVAFADQLKPEEILTWLFEKEISKYSQLGASAYSLLSNEFQRLSIKKQREILASPGTVGHLLNQTQEKGIKFYFGEQFSNDTAARLAEENQRLASFNQLHSAEIARILANFKPEILKLESQQIDEINQMLFTLNLQPPPRPGKTLFTSLVDTIIANTKTTLTYKTKQTSLYIAFGLKSDGTQYEEDIEAYKDFRAIEQKIGGQIGSNYWDDIRPKKRSEIAIDYYEANRLGPTRPQSPPLSPPRPATIATVNNYLTQIDGWLALPEINSLLEQLMLNIIRGNRPTEPAIPASEKEIEAYAVKATKWAMTSYTDVVKAWGGRAAGSSIACPRPPIGANPSLNELTEYAKKMAIWAGNTSVAIATSHAMVNYHNKVLEWYRTLPAGLSIPPRRPGARANPEIVLKHATDISRWATLLYTSLNQAQGLPPAEDLKSPLPLITLYELKIRAGTAYNQLFDLFFSLDRTNTHDLNALNRHLVNIKEYFDKAQNPEAFIDKFKLDDDDPLKIRLTHALNSQLFNVIKDKVLLSERVTPDVSVKDTETNAQKLKQFIKDEKSKLDELRSSRKTIDGTTRWSWIANDTFAQWNEIEKTLRETPKWKAEEKRIRDSFQPLDPIQEAKQNEEIEEKVTEWLANQMIDLCHNEPTQAATIATNYANSLEQSKELILSLERNKASLKDQEKRLTDFNTGIGNCLDELSAIPRNSEVNKKIAKYHSVLRDSNPLLAKIAIELSATETTLLTQKKITIRATKILEQIKEALAGNKVYTPTSSYGIWTEKPTEDRAESYTPPSQPVVNHRLAAVANPTIGRSYELKEKPQLLVTQKKTIEFQYDNRIVGAMSESTLARSETERRIKAGIEYRIEAFPENVDTSNMTAPEKEAAAQLLHEQRTAFSLAYADHCLSSNPRTSPTAPFLINPGAGSLAQIEFRYIVNAFKIQMIKKGLNFETCLIIKWPNVVAKMKEDLTFETGLKIKSNVLALTLMDDLEQKMLAAEIRDHDPTIIAVAGSITNAHDIATRAQTEFESQHHNVALQQKLCKVVNPTGLARSVLEANRQELIDQEAKAQKMRGYQF